MQFTYQALTWGFLIALIPLLIHLINMMRHRRIKWAAMEFLLQSYRKHRKWVWLKQLLLLLMRMLAVALVVAMLAQWDPNSQLFTRFGGQVTHHYILLDDSYSMGDESGGRSVFDDATQVITQIGNQARQLRQQRITLIRFSQALASDSSDSAIDRVDEVADLSASFVDKDFNLLLEEKRSQMQVSQLSVGAGPALELVQQLVADNNDEKCVVYLLSDFRENEWQSPKQVRQSLRELQDAEADIQLVQCSETRHQNLGITYLTPADETRAAGVPLFINVGVKNHGTEPARRVALKIRTIYHDPAGLQTGQLSELAGETDELPTVILEQIAPGETVNYRAQVYFPQAGEHVVEASLPDDAVPADNHRWSVIDFPEGERVLVIDGSPGSTNQYYLTSAFKPSQQAVTGIEPEIQPIQFLRDTSPEALSQYSAIYLLDVSRMDTRAVEHLEAFARSGGGISFFLGDQVDVPFYNKQLYREGEGILPLSLAGKALLNPPLEENTPDIEVTRHPIFEFFLGERNTLIRQVRVQQFMQPMDSWEAGLNSTTRIVSRLHNQLPLAVEQRFGDGRVVCFLTTLGPEWNSWARDPSFVVMLLKLHSYLTSVTRTQETRLVGAPLDVQLAMQQYQETVKFLLPGEDQQQRAEQERKAIKPETDSALLVASLGRPTPGTQRPQETGRSGIYDVLATSVDGNIKANRFAVNVEPAEGNLAMVTGQALVDQLDPVKVEILAADDFTGSAVQHAGGTTGFWLMWLLVGLLIGEQLLAYWTSYHPVRGPSK
ncbi:MAG: BatA domain-containing protein [Planctomycetota bacterium]|jgi:hypothetical protein|nr:BatA domain-containing protein [Planctomycetota bacterium]